MTQPAYMLFALTVTDEDTHQDYLAKAVDSLAGTGVEVVFTSDAVAAVEGDVPFERLVLLKFPSTQAARDWYSSPAYAAARQLRFASAATAFAAHIESGAAEGQ